MIPNKHLIAVVPKLLALRLLVRATYLEYSQVWSNLKNTDEEVKGRKGLAFVFGQNALQNLIIVFIINSNLLLI